VDARFDKLEASDKLEARFDKLEARFDKLRAAAKAHHDTGDRLYTTTMTDGQKQFPHHWCLITWCSSETTSIFPSLDRSIRRVS
jgi:hypothetical protein